MLSRGQKEEISPWVCILLGFLTLAVFWPVFNADLLQFDDPIYVNAHVLQGLSWNNVVWAFTNLDAGFWHPLTWLSLMLDANLSGTSAGGYHATNLLLHIINSVLVFLLFKRLTDRLWPSAWVAGLFALHPLHVETVSWVADRKDLLGTLFFLLTLLSYTSYVRSLSTVDARRSNAPRFYALTLIAFVLGIMSKTLVVTVPGVLLLLDWWPLNRLRLITDCRGRREESVQSSQSTEGTPHVVPYSPREVWQKGWRLVFEKLPFIALALGASALSLFAEKKAGAVTAATARTIPLRMENGILSYASYLRKMVWPSDLAPYYPYPTAFPIWKVVAAAVLLVGITILVLKQIRRRPYLAMGWFWYLGTLVPMIGVIQVGDHSMADRYTYVSLLGIFVAIVWWVADMSAERPLGRSLATAGAAACLAACAVLTWKQAGYWRNTRTLFEHAVAVTPENAVAQNDLGVCLLQAGELGPAEQHLREAVRISPGYGSALVNLGNCLGRQDRVDEAVDMLQKAVKTGANPQFHYNLAYWLIQKGNKEDAEVHFREAVRLAPAYVDAWFNLGLVSRELNKTEQSEQAFRSAVDLQPGYAPAQLRLGGVLVEQQKWDEALAHLQAGLQAIPRDTQGWKDLGVALCSLGRAAEAVPVLERGLQGGPDARTHYYLGLALHAQGRFTEAVGHYREAVRLDPKTSDYVNDLAWLLATCPTAEVRDGKEAVRLAAQLCQEHESEARFWGTLAAARAEAGQFDDAVKMAEKARDMAQRQNRDDVAKFDTQLLELFRQRKPYHVPVAR